jgi:hypothetical protein
VSAALDTARGWRSFHLVYHGDRDRLLREVVQPVVAELRADGGIEQAYFIRYDLGGPHVRLRLRPRPGQEDDAAGRVRAAFAAFVARAPSAQPLTDETVRERNRGIVPGDPFASDAEDVVYPDNSLHEAPPNLEVERYGGPARFGHSLDAFALSSRDTLAWLAEAGAPTPAARLDEGWRAAVRHAWAGARDGDEFLWLLAAPVPGDTSPMAAFAGRGDAAYERGAAGLRERMRAELVRLAASAAADPPRWTAGPLRLAPALADADDALRLGILHSHAHMTANRLGLKVPEEVYLARILWRSARELAREAPGLWHDMWVPYPVSSARLGELAADAGLSPVRVVATRPSAYGGQMYVGMAVRLANPE